MSARRSAVCCIVCGNTYVFAWFVYRRLLFFFSYSTDDDEWFYRVHRHDTAAAACARDDDDDDQRGKRFVRNAKNMGTSIYIYICEKKTASGHKRNGRVYRKNSICFFLSFFSPMLRVFTIVPRSLRGRRRSHDANTATAVYARRPVAVYRGRTVAVRVGRAHHPIGRAPGPFAFGVF